MSSNDGNFGVGLLSGLVVGAIIGILFAPKSGKETREKIAHYTSQVPEDLSVKLEETKDACSNLIDMTKINIEKQINRIHEAIKAGKMAAAKKRESLEEGYKYN